MIINLLFNSSSAPCRLGYTEVWIRSPPFLQVVKELSLKNSFKINFYPCHPISLSSPSLTLSPSSSRLISWSWHRMNLLNPVICSSPVHSSYMGWFAIYSKMVACLLQMYSFVCHVPVASKSSATNDHSYPPSPTRRSEIPAILRATLCWNPSSTFSISYVTTQLSLP